MSWYWALAGSSRRKGGLDPFVEALLAAYTLRLEDAYQRSYDNAIAHFVEALGSGNPFATDRLDNLHTLRLVAQAYHHAGL